MTIIDREVSLDDPTENRTTGFMMDEVYGELRRLAASKMAGERPDHTLQATALVNEAFLRLQGSKRWKDKGDFLAAAANAMRRILVDHAKRKKALKRQHEVVEFHDSQIAHPSPPNDLLVIDEALTLLEKEHPRAAEIVKLRYFIGFTAEEVATEFGLCKKTVDRDWALAKAWLHRHLKS